MKKLFILLTACATLGLAGCANRPVSFPVQDPDMRSILIVPVVNESHEVLAGNLMLSTMSWPLAERGYYTFPVNTVKFVCEQEGWYEPEKVHELEPTKLANMFNADAVLYARVKFWDATYMLVSTKTKITVDYYLYNRAGEKLVERQYTYAYQPDSSGSILADLVVAAIQRAAPDYKPLANGVNAMMVTNFAPGPYLVEKIQQKIEGEGSKAKE